MIMAKTTEINSADDGEENDTDGADDRDGDDDDDIFSLDSCCNVQLTN